MLRCWELKAPESAKLPSFDLRCTWLLSQLFLQKLSATLETNEFSEWLNASCSGYIRIKQTFRKQVKTQNAFGVALPFCPRNFANVLLDLYSERLSLTRLENVIRSCRYFYLSFPPPLQNIEPDQAMNIARSESQLWQAKGPSSGSCRSSSNCFLDFENKTTSKIKRFQLSKKNTLQTFSFWF